MEVTYTNQECLQNVWHSRPLLNVSYLPIQVFKNIFRVIVNFYKNRQFGKIGVLVNFIVEELKFWKLLSLMALVGFASAYVTGENLRGFRENLEHKITTQMKQELLLLQTHH